MTENEAIIEIKRWTNILMNAGSQCTLDTAEAQEMAIKTLKEIQQYRSIGTVEELKGMKEYEDLGITPDQIKELDKRYTEKCGQIKEIVKRLEKEAEEARAGGHPEISGAYQIAIWTIKDITGIGGLSDEQRNLISCKRD